MTANTDRSPLELRVADVRRSPPTGVRANEHLALLEGIDGSRRLIVRLSPREARLLAVVLTGDGAPALRQAIEIGWLQTVGGTLFEGYITGVADGRFAAEAVVASAEGTTTVALPLGHLLPQLVVAAAPLYTDSAALAAVERSPVHRVAMATHWGLGEGTVGAREIAAADVPPPAVAEASPAPPAPPPVSPRIRALGEQLAAGNRAALDAFWARIAAEGTPLVERTPDGSGEVFVTFLWRAVRPVGRVAVVRGLAGLAARRNLMARLGDSDLWYRTYRSRADARFTYLLSPDDSLADVADLGDDEAAWRERTATFRLDPLNRHPFPDDPLAAAVASTVALPAAPAQPWVAVRPGVPAGGVAARRFRSALLGNQRDVFVYTPPGYDPAGSPYDLLVLFDGWAYLESIPTPTILDNLLTDGRIPPTVAVIVDYPTVGARAEELPCNPRFADFLAHELLPWVGREYRVSADSARTVVAGASYGGLAAAYAAFRHPGRFGTVLSSSGSFWWAPAGDAEPDWLTRQFVRHPRLPVRFWLEVGLLEGLGDGDRDTVAPNRRLRDVLGAKGYAVQYREFNGGHDYVCWRGGLADGLIGLAGATETA